MRVQLRLPAWRAAGLFLGCAALFAGAAACGLTASDAEAGAGNAATAGAASTAGTSALAGTGGSDASSAGSSQGGGGNASGGSAASGGAGGSSAGTLSGGGTSSRGGTSGCEVADHAAQCWVDAVTPSLECLPDPHGDPYAEGGLMGIVTADGSKCEYPDGTSVTFEPPLPPPDDWLDEAPVVGYRVERDGQVCFGLERTSKEEVTAGAPYAMKLTTPGTTLESISDGARATIHCPDGAVLTLSDDSPSCPQAQNRLDSLIAVTLKMDEEGNTIASGVTFSLFAYRDGEQIQTAKCAMGDVSY